MLICYKILGGLMVHVPGYLVSLPSVGFSGQTRIIEWRMACLCSHPPFQQTWHSRADTDSPHPQHLQAAGMRPKALTCPLPHWESLCEEHSCVAGKWLSQGREAGPCSTLGSALNCTARCFVGSVRMPSPELFGMLSCSPLLERICGYPHCCTSPLLPYAQIP